MLSNDTSLFYITLVMIVSTAQHEIESNRKFSIHLVLKIELTSQNLLSIMFSITLTLLYHSMQIMVHQHYSISYITYHKSLIPNVLCLQIRTLTLHIIPCNNRNGNISNQTQLLHIIQESLKNVQITFPPPPSWPHK